VCAIVHCHSLAATIVASAGVNIPADFHYMSLALTSDLENGIRCAPFEIPGSEELARETVKALGSAKACLLGNHGQVAVGATPGEALDNAIMLEELCLVFSSMRPELRPRPIPGDKMRQMVALFANYQKK
jgi:L-fuculose-phosphate aldolase